MEPPTEPSTVTRVATAAAASSSLRCAVSTVLVMTFTITPTLPGSPHVSDTESNMAIPVVSTAISGTTADNLTATADVHIDVSWNGAVC